MNININTSMFYNAKPHIFRKAQLLRNNMTNAEKLLWEKIRKKHVLNLKFRSQHPIDIFIADFYCHQIKLVIEIDGEIHNFKNRKDYDISREDELAKHGISVIRFTNKEVEKNIDEVIKKIESSCLSLLKDSNMGSK
ncbi:endonuclease domain-containing protein [Saccharicrinis sp. FJH54]|uniref:endonuclease domain-containing protein n=1 Tax=Saccharicrinis sp. FJH54 TaxID=3344665 RepID=UPI0035D4E76A